MIVIFFLIPLSILVAACFLALFIWAVRSGQYEDTCTPSMRLLMEERKNKQTEGSEDKNITQTKEAEAIETKDD
jgi:cbb3-type cytochrome oxidase maturation protein